jgi:hypothetical protein
MKIDKQVSVQEFVLVNKLLRGKGTKVFPYRSVTEIFSKEGELIAENDVHSTTIEVVYEFIRWHFKEIPEEKITDAIYKYFVEENDNDFND